MPGDKGKRREIRDAGTSSHAGNQSLDVTRAQAVISPGGRRWEVSGQTPEMLTHREGVAREGRPITVHQLQEVWANSEIHRGGWRQVDASKEVHQKAQNAAYHAAYKREKRANDPEWVKKENDRKSAYHREKRANDPEWVKNENNRIAAYHREKQANDPEWVKKKNDKKAASYREKRAKERAEREQRGPGGGSLMEEREEGVEREQAVAGSSTGTVEARMERQALEQERQDRGYAQGLMEAQWEQREQTQDQQWFADNEGHVWLDRGNDANLMQEPRRTFRVTGEHWQQARWIRTDTGRFRAARLEESVEHERQEVLQRGSKRSYTLDGALG